MLELSYTGRYWINYGDTNYGSFETVFHYDKNNIYSSGYSSSTKNALVRKTDIGGNCIWARQFGDGTNQTISFNSAVDSFGNFYVLATTFYTTNRDFNILKYNPSGVLQWKKKLNATGSNGTGGIVIDSSDNIYVSGWTNQSGAGAEDMLLMRLDSSANIIWQKTLGSAGTETSSGLTFDSSGNVIVAAYNNDDMLIVKYNSSGELQWQRKFGKVKVENSDGEYSLGVAVDSNDNIYVVGYEQDQTTDQFFGQTIFNYYGVLVKYNSSGVIQWQKRALKPDTVFYNYYFTVFYGITIDSNDNIYVVGRSQENRSTPLLTTYPAYIAKLNTSGSVQWERGLYRGTNTAGGNAMSFSGSWSSIDEYGDLCVAGGVTYTGSVSADYTPLLFKVPSDGSLVGRYGTDGIFQYASFPLTWSNGTYSDSAASFTEGTSSFSFTDSSLTESAYSCSYLDNIIKISGGNQSLTITGEYLEITN